MPELSSGDGYIRELKSAIVKALVFFCGKIDELPSRERGPHPAYVSLGVDCAEKRRSATWCAQIGRFLEERHIKRCKRGVFAVQNWQMPADFDAGNHQNSVAVKTPPEENLAGFRSDAKASLRLKKMYRRFCFQRSCYRQYGSPLFCGL